MKTILARFQSLTKDPDSLSPEVQEALGGETVDANVTEAALAKAGVALRDETGQFRAAKDVLLELNAVWNDLDKNTQRYIATQTAGARQQSRFIAMMQNNARTQELLGYAYNAEGASQKQFEKTLDSLEAKVNKFKNAWNEFTMGVANNAVIKATVDVLTDFLSIINKITGSIDGPFGSAISMITKSLIAIGGFKLGGSVVNQIIKILSGNFDREAIDISKIGIKGALQLGGSVFSQFSSGFKKASNKFDWIKAIFSEGKLNGLKELGSRGKSGIESLLDSAYQNVEFGKLKGAGLGDKAAGSLMQNIDAFKKYQDLLKSGKTAEEAYAAAVLMTNAGMGDKAAMFYASKAAVTEENAAIIGSKLGLEGQTLATFKATAQEKGFAAALREVALAEGEAATGGYAMLGPLLIIGAALAAAGIAWAVYSKSIGDACERAEESIKSFNETKDSINENLNSIEEVRSEFELLRKGVSTNGENISLSADEFERYHEIANKLAEMSPSIVDGYDAEGNAIISETNAIQELIEAEKERADLNRRKYVSNSNLSDLITKAREDSRGITEEFNRKTGQMGLAADSSQSFNINDVKDYKEKRDKIVEQIKKKEKEIDEYNGDLKQKNWLQQELEEQQKQLEILDAQKESADQLKDAYSDVTDLLTEYTKTLEGGEAILNKYPSILNNALTSIATDTSLDEVGKKQAVQELITNSDFRAATVQMDVFKYKAKQLKEELGDTKDATEYNNAWKKAYKEASNTIDNFDNLSEDVKEDFKIQMKSMKDGASELAPTLEEALNPLETAVDTAKDLKETLDKVSENDYFSAGNGIKEGISAATEEEDTWGYGSKTLWEAGFKTLNGDYVKKLQKAGNNEQLIKDLKNIDKYMSGEQAANAFYDKLIKDGLMKEAEDGSVTIDDIDAISRKYHWDSSTTYAALSNLEQLVGEISYTSSKLPDAIERASNEQNSGVVSNNKEGKQEKYALSKKALQASGATDSQIKSINKDKRYSVFDPSANKGTDILNQLRTFAGIKDNVSTQSETESMFEYYYNMQADIDDAVEATKKLWNTDKIGGDFKKEFQTADGGFDEAKFASAYGDAITSFESPLVDPITDIQANVAKIAGEEPEGDSQNGSEGKEPVKPIEQIRAEHQVEAGQKFSEIIKKINIPKPSEKQLKSKIYGGSDGKKQSGKASKIISGLMSKWKEFNTVRATQGVKAKNQTGDGQLIGKLQERVIKWFSPLEKVGDIIDSFIEAIDSIAKKITEIFSGDGILSHFGFGKSSDNSGKGKSKTNTSTTVIKVKDKASSITKKIKKEFSKIPDETNTTLKSKDKASSKIKTVKSKADNLNKQKPVVKITAEDNTGSVFSTIRAKLASLMQKALKVGGPKAAKGKNLASSAFGQNILGSAAKGAKRGRIGPRGKGGLTLTGELGPELVWEPSKGYSYITGSSGPEMRNLSGDAVVWPADQTKKIMRTAANGQNVFGSAGGTKGKVKATAPGKKDNYKGSSTVSTKTTTTTTTKHKKSKNKGKNKGKKKNNNKKKQKYIKRLFDRWYNAALRFEKFQKKVELAEKKLENWRQYNFKTFEEVGQQFKDIITNLNNQILQAKAAQTAAKQQRTAAKKAKLRDSDGKVIKKKKISSYVKFDKDGMAYLTTKGLKLKDNKLGNAVKEYIENYNAAWEEEKKWEAQIIDLQKEMIEQLNKERDNYISLLERTRDALVQKIQKQIDKESKIIEAINDANSKLIDSMSKNLSKMRQDRDNKKTEEELQDKYAQLNAMKRIGSGENASDIKKLEKEIKNLEQNYTDSLVDQKISDFQERNDSASQRKQTAIEIAQALSEARSENGYFNEEAIQMIKDAMADGIYNSDDALWELLNEAENQNKTAVEIAKHTEEITSLLQGVFNYFNGAVKKGMQTQGYEGQKYAKFVDSKGNETNIMAGKEFTGNGTITAGGKKYTGVTFGTDDKYHYTGVEEVKTASASNTSKPKSHAHGYLQKVDNKSYKRLSKSDKSYLAKGLNDLIADKKIKAKKKDSLSTKVKAAEKKAGVKKPNGTWDAKGAKKIKKKFPKYATGGIADFTGPAWLDGTPSKPELILNAQDSKNFILLKDALSNISSGTVAPSGDNYYDISINVDKLSSDYDVDQVANKIKKMIVNDSKYRGVSSVRRSK